MNTHILQLALPLRTIKWPVLAAALSWLIALALTGFLLWQQQSHIEQADQISALRSQLDAQPATALPAPVALRPEQAFESILGDPKQLEKYLGTLFEIAGKQRLTLKQGNYKTIHSTLGNHDAYSIDLPISGSYSKIKSVSEQVLLALPFSALEEIKFKRENVADAALETQLRFTLFLKPSQRPLKSNDERELRMDSQARAETGGHL